MLKRGPEWTEQINRLKSQIYKVESDVQDKKDWCQKNRWERERHRDREIEKKKGANKKTDRQTENETKGGDADSSRGRKEEIELRRER